jgi:hypothetical protein
MANCARRNLRALSYNQAVSARYLDPSGNRLGDLTLLGEELPYLKLLNASRNRLHSIVDSFYSAKNLEIVDLSYNGLYSIGRSSIAGLTSLQSMDLRGNKLVQGFYFYRDYLGNPQAVLYLDSYLEACCMFSNEIQVGCEFIEEERLSSCDRVLRFLEINAILWICGIIGALSSLHQLFRVCHRRNKNELIFAFKINIPVVGFITNVYVLSESVLSQMDPVVTLPSLEEWRQSGACHYFAVMALFSFLSSMMVGATHAVHELILPFHRPRRPQKAISKKSICIAHLFYHTLIFLIPALLSLPYGTVSGFSEAMRLDETCSPLVRLVQGELSGSVRAYIASLAIGSCSVTVVLTAASSWYAGVTLRKRSQEHFMDDEADKITERVGETSGRTVLLSAAAVCVVVVDFSASLIVVLMSR